MYIYIIIQKIKQIKRGVIPLTNDAFERKMKKIQQKNEKVTMKNKLREEKRKGRLFKLPSTSKLVVLGMFLLVLEIIIFAEVAMMRFGDFSAMYVLIGIPATMIPTIMAYFSKSKSENTAGGIVYETAMAEFSNNQEGGYL